MTCPTKIIFFLKPIDAMSIMQVLTIYEKEIDQAFNAEKATLTDHTYKQAILQYRKQLKKQFGTEELEDIKEDLSIFNLLNPTGKKK